MEKDSHNKFAQRSLIAHKKSKGKIEIRSRMPLETQDDLSIAYTPGVAGPCNAIAADRSKVYDYTSKSNMIAVVSDGSAVLGLGNIGAEAGLPVMEGKCVLFKKFGNVDAVPVVLNTQDTEEIINVVKAIAPTYGGINLEDIASPKCFEVEARLKNECDIPIMHDDQHGTAIVTLAAMINAMKVIDKELGNIKIVVNGAGSAGVAIVKLLLHAGVKEIIICDRAGIIYEGREKLNEQKRELAQITNKQRNKGNLADAMHNADVFIGVSSPDVVSREMIQSMHRDPLVFALANPVPEIMPEDAHDAGARIVATGRSDYPNQINNVLAFPGIFRGILDARGRNFTRKMFMAAAHAIASCVGNPSEKEIIPSPFNPEVSKRVAKAVYDVCIHEGDELNWK